MFYSLCSQCFFSQLVESDTRHQLQEHRYTGSYILHHRDHQTWLNTDINAHSSTHHCTWILVKFSDGQKWVILATGMQWPTEDLGTLCVHLIRTSGMSVASGPLPSFLQLSSVGSWIYFTVPWCYRVLASHQPSPKRLLTMSAAELSQRNSCQL